jgi:hypothetical protein
MRGVLGTEIQLFGTLCGSSTTSTTEAYVTVLDVPKDNNKRIEAR